MSNLLRSPPFEFGAFQDKFFNIRLALNRRLEREINQHILFYIVQGQGLAQLVRPLQFLGNSIAKIWMLEYGPHGMSHVCCNLCSQNVLWPQIVQEWDQSVSSILFHQPTSKEKDWQCAMTYQMTTTLSSATLMHLFRFWVTPITILFYFLFTY